MAAAGSAVASKEFAEVLRRHQQRLKIYVEEWSEQQERIIASASEHTAEQQRSQVVSFLPASSPASPRSQELHGIEIQFPHMLVAEGKIICESGVLPEPVAQTHGHFPHQHFHRHGSIAEFFDEAVEETTVHSKFVSIQQAQRAKWQVRKNGPLQRFIQSRLFDGLTMSVIVLNSLFMAYSVDHTIGNQGGEQTKALGFMEFAFSGYYLVEITLRLMAEQWYFFFGESASWNIFDLLLVLYSVAEVVMDQSQQQADGVNVGFLRAIRVCKILKVLRIVRVLRSLRELRLIINSLAGSMRTLLWSLLLILGITFMLAIFLMQPLSQYMVDHPGSLEPELQASVDKYWCSVMTAMISLYMSCTGGESWSNIAKPLKAVAEPFYWCFMAYIALFMFVIVNALASIFIEATMANADKEDKTWIREEMKKKNTHIKLIKRLFSRMDSVGEGQVTRDTFMASLDDPQMLAFLNHIGIDAIDAEDCFDVLASNSGQDHLDIEAFVLGCMKIKGNARSIDLQGLIHKHDSCASRLIKSVNRCESVLLTMQEQFSTVAANNIVEVDTKPILPRSL